MPERSSICGWRVHDSFSLEGVDDILKLFFALIGFHEILEGGKFGSVVLEFSLHSGELLGSLKFFLAFEHFLMQVFEFFWFLIIINLHKN